MATTGRNRKTVLKIAVIVVAAVLAVGTAGYKLYGRSERGITATGTIEVTKTDITPKVGGYLAELKIREGDAVKQGQVVAVIDRPDLNAQLWRDEAALAKAKAQLRDLEQGARAQELQEASANLAAARSQAIKAQADFQRYSTLFREGAIATQQLDASRSAHEVAANALTAAESRYSLLLAGSRPDTIAAQRMEVERSEAVLAASQTQVADLTVSSPLPGRVLSKNYERGEYVNAGAAIATVGDMNDCWVKIYVSTEQLGKIRLGQAAGVKIDAYPDKSFRGEIKEISQNAEYTPRQSITQRERANMVFAVKVKLTNPAEIMKPGLPADVIIE
ncbi:MAG: HlyD family efflux transporter periplasmic adaptor subunit [Veillonellaceae bacterium]|nr:HlyD family efflux transporter periplasmic adaptor subunit [Veillonellaceae bacterium]